MIMFVGRSFVFISYITFVNNNFITFSLLITVIFYNIDFITLFYNNMLCYIIGTHLKIFFLNVFQKSEYCEPK